MHVGECETDWYDVRLFWGDTVWCGSKNVNINKIVFWHVRQLEFCKVRQVCGVEDRSVRCEKF